MSTHTNNPLERARSAFMRAVGIATVQLRERATVGWARSSTSVQIAVPGRPNMFYVTKSDATVQIALNRAGVPQQAFLPVWLVLENNSYVIHSRDNSDANALVDVPDDPSGVPSHTHVHATLTDLDEDDHTQYHNDERGDVRYYLKGEHINVSAGAADAGKPIVLNASGEVDTTMLPAGQDPVADQIVAAATDDTIADTDVFGYVTTATLVKTAWSNIKAVLKTYFDTLYGLLATANTWTQNQTVASTQTSGNALRVVRDLAAASTDAPVVDIVQDNAGDDQIALRVQQDGTGAIVEILDGATVVWRLNDGGRVDIAQIVRALTSSGLQLQDDGGNIALVVADGGNIGTGGITDPQQSLEVSGPDAASTSMRITSHGTALNTSLSIYTPRGTRASPSANLAGDKLGLVTFGGFDTNISNSAQIRAEAAADFGSGGDSSDSPGNLIFATTPDGSGTLTDRMIILSTGVVIIGGLTSVGATLLGIQAGSSANDAAVGGILYAQPLAVGNVGAGEDDLLNFSLPANTLSVNGMALEIWAVFSVANNANAKTLKIHFGATQLASTSLPTGGPAAEFVYHLICMRTGATAQRWIVTTEGGTPNVVTSAETLSGAVAIRFTGEGVSNGDITLNQVSIEYKDSNT